MDGEHRTATSTFTQRVSSDRSSKLLYVHRDHKNCCGGGGGGGEGTSTSNFTHLLSSELVSFKLNVALRPQRP